MYWLPLLILAQSFPLETTQGLKTSQTRVEAAQHRGLKGVKVVESGPLPTTDPVVLVEGVQMLNGSIEIELAGAPGASASGTARGFVGVAFRVVPELNKYEAFYLRPTNGRAEDQVRRNHSAQYISHPDYPWERLRKQFPEMYESYVDLEPGVWTRVRIEVEGTKARLYVHGNSQPTLVVNDLKLAPTRGGIALWIGPGTDAYFRNLRVTVKD